MAIILEFMTKDKMFTPQEVLEDNITHLIGGMWYYIKLGEPGDFMWKAIEKWRVELGDIRSLIQNNNFADALYQLMSLYNCLQEIKNFTTPKFTEFIDIWIQHLGGIICACRRMVDG